MRRQRRRRHKLNCCDCFFFFIYNSLLLSRPIFCAHIRPKQKIKDLFIIYFHRINSVWSIWPCMYKCMNSTLSMPFIVWMHRDHLAATAKKKKKKPNRTSNLLYILYLHKFMYLYYSYGRLHTYSMNPDSHKYRWNQAYCC